MRKKLQQLIAMLQNLKDVSTMKNIKLYTDPVHFIKHLYKKLCNDVNQYKTYINYTHNYKHILMYLQHVVKSYFLSLTMFSYFSYDLSNVHGFWCLPAMFRLSVNGMGRQTVLFDMVHKPK